VSLLHVLNFFSLISQLTNVFTYNYNRGGNYMVFGGGVKGRQIVGTYPDDLTDDGPLSLGRGRMIPTTSWEAVFLPLAQWAGAGANDLDEICPNRDNFPASHFRNTADLFEMN
jgi:uncharacterized protein (DUF1501 family)